MLESATPLLRVDNLRVDLAQPGLRRSTGRALAVDGVSLSVDRGMAMGVVGESGSGKTTLARAIMGLVPSTGGRVMWDGVEHSATSRNLLRGFRNRNQTRRNLAGLGQMVFQDPDGSLNPRMTIGATLAEPLRLHRIVPRRQEGEHVIRLLEDVGLSTSYLGRYPHELSGGQRQRVGIARALALKPALLICDEPVSALDVSVQSQIINLLTELKQRLGLALLFITHDLALVRQVCDVVMVMRNGRVVEAADSRDIFACPVHPYTRELIACSGSSPIGARSKL